MITNIGKDIVVQYFAGAVGAMATSIVLGTGSSAAALTDTRLGFEAVRLPIVSVSPDLANGRVIFKANLTPGLIGKVYEAGLIYSSNVTTNSRSVDVAQGGVVSWTGGTFSSSNARRGSQTLKVDASANGTSMAETTGLALDLSALAGTDSVAVAYQADANLSSLRIRIGNDATHYREFTYSSPVVGYNINRVNWSTGVDTGTVDTGNLTYFAVRASAKASGATSVYFDGLGIEDNVTDSRLVARSVLGTPATIDSNIVSEIEYSLEVTA